MQQLAGGGGASILETGVEDEGWKGMVMARKMSRRRRKEAFLMAASEAFDGLEEWYDEHPESTFGEIEQEARRRRRELMGKALEVLVNGRDNGVQVEGVECEQCGAEMDFKGYLPWTVHGLEGDAELERAYYVCPECKGETIFPPRPETRVAERPLE
jgi:hypothetical protein